MKDGTVEKLFYKHFEDWKTLIANHSKFYHRDADIRSQEQQEYLNSRDAYEKERLAGLLYNNREGLPPAAE